MDKFKDSYKIKTRESLPIAVYNSGIQRCEPGYRWGPGIRDHFLIHHVISGKGTYHCDETTHTLSPGDTFLIHPSVVVSYEADLQEPWEYCWVGFSSADARILIAQTPFAKQKVVRFPDQDAIARAILAIHDAAGAFAAAELRAIGSLYLFLALLTESASFPTIQNPTLQYVESAVGFMMHNYSGKIEVSDIARHVGLSRSHLYRVFMQSMDASPNEYLTRFRISQACKLLKQSTLSVGAVAASVGFEDPLYFSRVFKKITGQPPTLYANT